MPPELLPYVPIASLVISIIALFMSGVGLGWSIYKDFGLRARLKVHFGLKSIHHATFERPLIRFVLSVTNLGPGKLRITTLRLRDNRWWRRILRKTRYALLIHDYEHPLGGKLPHDLEVSDGMDLSFSKDISFVSEGFTQIGITDSFGRTHWCRQRDMKEARRDLENRNKREAIPPTQIKTPN